MQDFYRLAMYQTIQLGGDTDTNACIVGGLMGAVVGISNLPSHMVKKLLSFDCTKIKKDKNGNNIGRPRPLFLSVRANGITGIQSLLRCQPLSVNDVEYIVK